MSRKHHVIFIIHLFLCILIFGTSQSLGLTKLSKQEGSKDNYVSLELVEKVADVHASMLWGPEFARGKPVPILDEKGMKAFYAFPFIKGSLEFPGSEKLKKDLEFPGLEKLKKELGEMADSFLNYKEMETNPYLTPQYHAFLKEARKEELLQYCTIYVSARDTNFPVPRVTNELHPYFYQTTIALKWAGKILHTNQVKLTGIKMIAPCYEYFEITDGKSHIRLHINTFFRDEEMNALSKPYQPEIKIQELNEKEIQQYKKNVAQAWKYYREYEIKERKPFPFPSTNTEYYIPYYLRMPPILWTRWCAPTAAAMVFAYWDHYVPQPGVGTHVGYERIVDYWLDHPTNSNNVPNTLDEIIAANTYQDFANVLNGYNWSFSTTNGTSQNDFAWNDIVAELHAGRPLRWQIYPQGKAGHAVAVFGYRTVFNQKYLKNYTTWSTTWDEWLHDHYYWSGGGVNTGHVEVNKYIPGGKELYNTFFIRYPYGGEIFHVNQRNRIKFYVQNNIKKTRIEYSLNGGRTWHFIVELSTQTGWNYFNWTPRTPSTKARIRIKGLSQSRQYLAGDSSFKNFTIQ